MKYLSSTVNAIAAEQIDTTAKLCRRQQRIFIRQFDNFYTAAILIHSAAFPEIFVEI